MKILFLDDMQVRHDRFENLCAERFGTYIITNTFSAQQAIEALEMDTFDEIWLDHDLGEHKPATGMDVANYLCTVSDKHGETPIYIHSMNFIRGGEMMKRLIDAGYRAIQVCPP